MVVTVSLDQDHLPTNILFVQHFVPSLPSYFSGLLSYAAICLLHDWDEVLGGKTDEA
jgi:hypothetical protein